jgi:hypothetical protein
MSERKIWEKSPELTSYLDSLETPLEFNQTNRIILCNEELGDMVLTGADAAKILLSAFNVEFFFDAIDRESDCTVEISGAENLPPEVLEKFQELFSYAEEV